MAFSTLPHVLIPATPLCAGLGGGGAGVSEALSLCEGGIDRLTAIVQSKPVNMVYRAAVCIGEGSWRVHRAFKCVRCHWPSFLCLCRCVRPSCCHGHWHRLNVVMWRLCRVHGGVRQAEGEAQGGGHAPHAAGESATLKLLTLKPLGHVVRDTPFLNRINCLRTGIDAIILI